MRESQMKKIIAVAVAGAFAAPVMAADVTLSGNLEYVFVSDDQANTADFIAEDAVVAVGASSELANGMSISGAIAIEGSDENSNTEPDGGNNIAISGDFGKLQIGDVSGGLDAFGDYTDVAAYYGGFDADGDDAAFAFTPNLGIAGLKAVISATPEGDANNTEGTSYGVEYSVGAFSAYYGKDETAAAASQMSAAGFKYSADGIMVAYETGESPQSSSGKVEYKGVAATYSMGDLKFGIEMQEQKDDGTVDSDETTLSATYDLGGGASVYLVNTEDEKTSTKVDKSAIGINFAF
jgi:hypothetical protein